MDNMQTIHEPDYFLLQSQDHSIQSIRKTEQL